MSSRSNGVWGQACPATALGVSFWDVESAERESFCVCQSVFCDYQPNRDDFYIYQSMLPLSTEELGSQLTSESLCVSCIQCDQKLHLFLILSQLFLAKAVFSFLFSCVLCCSVTFLYAFLCFVSRSGVLYMDLGFYTRNICTR